ncbi:MAG: hypothetical protein HC923_02510 [Myxococcales bacterium]|nr:hypothetical protein [Myxococcales bacterium]
MALTVGRRFEEAMLPDWTKNETSDLAWLVREHLTMSDLSQRRDVTDPELLKELATSARSLERLSMLYMLTFADMLGTSPRVWTSWKGNLLQQLYKGASRLDDG